VQAAGSKAVRIDEKAGWRSELTIEPPTPEWLSLTERIAAGDEEWARRIRLGSPREEWLGWEARNDQVIAEWKDVAERSREIRSRRFSRAALLAKVGFVASAGLVLAGVLRVTTRFLGS
jgi:hypothetical protein